MSTPHTRRPGASERGIALIIALLVLLLISAVGMGMIMASNTETNISSNFRDEQVAFFAARAGIEEVRDRLRSSATNSLLANLPPALPGQVNGVLYVTNPASGETVSPWLTTAMNYPDDVICLLVTCTAGVPATGWSITPALSASTSYAPSPKLPWKWVSVMAKINKSDTGTTRVTSVDGTLSGSRVCWNGTNEVVTALASCQAANIDYKQVYVLTALAVTNSGSRRMIQYEVTTSAFPPPPGAMVFDGPAPIYNAPNSNAFNVNGNDADQGPNNGAGCGAASNQAAVGGFDPTSVTTLKSDIPKPLKYTGSSGSTPDVQNVNSLLKALTTVDGLQQLINNVTSAAVPPNIYNGNTSSLTNPGTNAAPVINVVQGDLSTGGGFTGAGILLVTGTLTMSGNPNYNGIIYVIGKGVFTKNGGGNGTLNGSVFVANLYNSSGVAIPLGSGNAPGAPTINWNGGGNATIQYDTCWINSVTQSFPFRTLAQRELVH